MAIRRPLVVIGGVKQELPTADTIAQSLIEGLATSLAGKVSKSGDTMTGGLEISTNGALSVTVAGDDLISLQGIGRIFHIGTSLGTNTLAITNLGASTVDLQLDDAGLDVYRPRIRVGSNVVWHAGNLLNIGTTAATARAALEIASFGGVLAPLTISPRDFGVVDNSIVTGLWRYSESDGDTGGPIASDRGAVLHTRRAAGGGETQLYLSENSDRMLRRRRVAGAWSAWSEFARLEGAQTWTAVQTFTAGNPLRFDAAAGTARRLDIRTAGLQRWQIGADGTAEGGSNAGSLFVLQRFSDAGASLGTAWSVDRATGTTTLEALTVSGAMTLNGAFVVGAGGYLINRRVIPRVYLESPNQVNGYYIDSNVSDSVFGGLRIVRRDNATVLFEINNAAQITSVATITTTGAITAGGTLTGRTQTRAQNADNSHSLRMEIGGDNSKNLLAAGGVAPLYVGNQFGVTDQPVYIYNNNAVRLTINANGSIVAGARYQTSIAAAGWAYLANVSGSSAGGVWADSASQVRFVNAAFSAGMDLTAGLTTIYGTVKPSSLAGTGTRMVVAASDGTLSTQAIPGGGAAAVTSVFTRTGDVVADVADYAAFYLRRDGANMMTGDLDIDAAISGARLRFFVAPPLAPDPAEYINLFISSGALVISDDVAGDLLTLSPTTGTTIHSLSGSGTRMVVAGAAGQLSTQAVPKTSTWLRQGSTAANSTVVAANTDLQFSAAINTRYLLRGYCRYTSAATTTGMRVRIIAPSGASVSGWASFRSSTSVGTDSEQTATWTSSNSDIVFTTSITNNGTLEFWAIVEMSVTAGTVGLAFASEVGTSAVQLLAGAVMSYDVLP